MKLALALQVYEGDVWLGKRLLGIICSIEKHRRDDIEFIISARRGVNEHAVRDLEHLARTKFSQVFTIRGKRFGKGWPSGPNDLWQETMMRIGQLRGARRIKSTGVFTLEPDDLPMLPNWIDLLAEEWAKAEELGKQCVGHAHRWPMDAAKEVMGEPAHINGNAIFATDIIRKYPVLEGSLANQGWDCHHAKLLLKIGIDTPLIYQLYRIKDITKPELRGIRKDGRIPALFHGIKGTVGMEIIEQMISDGSFYERSDSDPRGCIVKSHFGGGFFSLLNNVVTCHGIYDHVHVLWDENCVYTEDGINLWDKIFTPTLPPPGDYEKLVTYPDWSMTFKYAGRLYKGDKPGWREKYHAIWHDHIRPHMDEQVKRNAKEFVDDNIEGQDVVGMIVRSAASGGEQLREELQDIEEYFRELDKIRKPDTKVFVMASDQESFEYMKVNLGDSMISYPKTKRGSNRKVDRHLDEEVGVEDARTVLEEVMAISQCRALIHPISNMATAALYMNPDLQSVYLE